MIDPYHCDKQLDVHGKYFEIDDTVDLGNFCSLHGGYTKETALKIGAHTYISTGSIIMAITHLYKSKIETIESQGMTSLGLTIGKDCWIGANAVIKPGLVIGDGVVVGAGAVVTKSIPDYEIWVGVPARKIGERI
jgi:acetyltransferase-like isoleucine patch superfamily enzyme